MLLKLTFSGLKSLAFRKQNGSKIIRPVYKLHLPFTCAPGQVILGLTFLICKIVILLPQGSYAEEMGLTKCSIVALCSTQLIQLYVRV